MFIKEVNGQFMFSDSNKTLRYEKEFAESISKTDENGNEYREEVSVIKNVVVFNPQPEHFYEAGYRELVETPMPETKPHQYVKTTYELKNDKYYEVHIVNDMPEVTE